MALEIDLGLDPFLGRGLNTWKRISAAICEGLSASDVGFGANEPSVLWRSFFVERQRGRTVENPERFLQLDDREQYVAVMVSLSDLSQRPGQEFAISILRVMRPTYALDALRTIADDELALWDGAELSQIAELFRT